MGELIIVQLGILGKTYPLHSLSLELLTLSPESTEPSSGGTGRGPDRDGDRIVLADLGWMAPVVDLLPVRGAAHAVAAGSRALSLADSCGASWRDLRLACG